MKRAALRRTLKIQSFLEEKNHGDQKRKEGFRAVIGQHGVNIDIGFSKNGGDFEQTTLVVFGE